MTSSNSRLSPEEAADIRSRCAQWVADGNLRGDFVRQEARRFRVGIETIRRLLRGETYPDYGRGEVPSSPLPGREDEDVTASLARLQAALERAGAGKEEVNRMVDEVPGKPISGFLEP